MSQDQVNNPSRGKRRGRRRESEMIDPVTADQEQEDHNDHRQTGLFMIIREWIDPFIFAFLLAMFIRTFIVELFKIPSGSMTPTLVGDVVAEMDFPNDKGIIDEYPDLVVGDDVQGDPNRALQGRFQIFMNSADGYVRDKPTPFVNILTPPLSNRFHENMEQRFDRICVNKFAYWFKPAERGDVVVFKVPRNIFTREKPIYVKRVAGLPDETIEITNGRLHANGQPVTKPDFFKDQFYSQNCNGRKFNEAKLNHQQYLMLGDNTLGSLDGRAWGPVDGANFRGKAFFRYMPLGKVRFLR